MKSSELPAQPQTVTRFSAPRSLAETSQTDGKIRGSWPYNTSLQNGAHSDPFDFATEAASYHERVLLGRTKNDQSAIRAVADSLQLDSETRVVCCILCHASEPTELYNINGIAELIAGCNGHTVVYINASAPDYSQSDCEAAATRLRARLDREPHIGRSVSVLTHLFASKQPIGTIRGILTDGVVTAAAEAGLQDPVLVSTDIDFVAAAPGYGDVLLQAFDDPKCDILSGPVFYGYDHLGNDHTDIGLKAPELFLGNRAFYYKKIAAAQGLILGVPYNPTDGPNTAYRLSAYCAAGGHRYEFQSGEDNYIGSAIFALRNDDFSTIPHPKHAFYNPSFWVATDPRRQLQAVALGYPIDETWREIPFYQKLGSSMVTSEIASVYHQNDDLIQLEDLNGAFPDKVEERISSIFDASISGGAFPIAAINFQALEFGLTASDDNRYSMQAGGELATLLADFPNKALKADM